MRIAIKKGIAIVLLVGLYGCSDNDVTPELVGSPNDCNVVIGGEASSCVGPDERPEFLQSGSETGSTVAAWVQWHQWTLYATHDLNNGDYKPVGDRFGFTFSFDNPLANPAPELMLDEEDLFIRASWQCSSIAHYATRMDDFRFGLYESEYRDCPEGERMELEPYFSDQAFINTLNDIGSLFQNIGDNVSVESQSKLFKTYEVIYTGQTRSSSRSTWAGHDYDLVITEYDSNNTDTGIRKTYWYASGGTL